MPEIAYMKIVGAEQYKALARRLKEAGRGDLQRKLTRNIRKVGDPALRATKSAWMGIEVSSSRGGGGSTGLRARVAAATRISILGSGIRIRVESKRVDPNPTYGRSLPYYLDNLGKQWRHPVFGNYEVWEWQRGEEVFFKTLTAYEPKFRKGVEEAMEEIAREIEG